MKNGEVQDLDLSISGGDSIGMLFGEDEGAQMAIRTKTLSDRWVTAINHQLGKNVKNEIDALKEKICQLENKK